MRRAEEHIARIGTYDRAGLQRLWQRIQNNQRTGFPAGKAFEHLVLRAFELEGADIVWPYEVELEASTIEQIDGAMHLENFSCLVEAKDYQDRIDVGAIAKMRNQLLRRPASAIGIVFAKNGFTAPARVLATYTAPQTILLWEGEEIELPLARGRMLDILRMKLRHAIEQGVGYYDTREVLRQWNATS